MKKYVVKHTLVGKFENSAEAIQKFKKHINDFKDGDVLSPFSFELEEVECDEVNEVITDFYTARKLLFGEDLCNYYSVGTRIYSVDLISSENLEMFINEINKKHFVALVALNRLFTIAEAWNKEDGFVPDFSDWHQEKWFPWFSYDKKTAVFVFVYTDRAYTSATAAFGSRLCFKTRERAEQFGKQFIELYNKAFLINK